MKIAIDAMGGDYAPAEIVKGAVQAASLYGVEIVLVGDKEAILKSMPKSALNDSRIQIRHTSEMIGMKEPAAAFRTKKEASVVICAEMVRDGQAQAMISVGNTASAMAVATFKLGRIEGIDRPAIATDLPTITGRTILLDAGATADCDVANLMQFALMGSVYAEKVMSIPNPRVALLSIGEEECKGNELTKLAHTALRDSGLNFIGNVEGRHLFMGAADVIVCDGFTGNIALKSAEGLGEYVLALIKQEAKNPIGRLCLGFSKPILRRLKYRIDYTEHGGAPLLGVNGICIIGHGRSNAKAISSAVKAAVSAVEHNVISSISTSLCNVTPKSVKVV
ncbi:MAG: phosphate acyltransferase PlsX [Armatimonadota bacterium]|nr:phosphate acyltransferase PlsX [Armatimonadota bacterium]